MTTFDALLPADDPDYVCATCGGSGLADPDQHVDGQLALPLWHPCDDCDGRGETN